jgi:predicted RNase H-like HicB family nuclease
MKNDAIGAWPERVNLSIWIKSEGDGMYGALVEEFSIAGQGRSLEAARMNAVELTLAYLNTSMAEGVPFDEVRRSIPKSLKLKLHSQAQLSKALAKLSSSMPKLQLVADSEDLSDSRAVAHC